MKMADLISSEEMGIEDVERLGRFLLDHGVDLATTPAPEALERGTPVYVDAGADPLEVQRRMAQALVRMLFVLDSGAVIGVVDTAELTRKADSLPWPVGPLPRSLPG